MPPCRQTGQASGRLTAVGDTALLYQTGPALTSRSPISCSNYYPTGPSIPLATIPIPLPIPGTPSFPPHKYCCQGGPDLVQNVPTRLVNGTFFFPGQGHICRGILRCVWIIGLWDIRIFTSLPSFQLRGPAHWHAPHITATELVPVVLAAAL